MLSILHRIVQEVNSAPDLNSALEVIVREVKRAVKADVCSVYLTDYEGRKHVLSATHGLRQEAVGKVSLPMHRGLIGLVCERAEPLNLDDAPSHPRYLFVTDTGEVPYHGFLGVPVIQNRKVLGVLVVRQRKPRKFEDKEVTFLFTLAAQLAGAITHAQAQGELNGIAGPDTVQMRFLQGRPSASGVAVGNVVVAYRPDDLDVIPDRRSEQPELEILQLEDAVARVEDSLRRLQSRLGEVLPAEEKALFDALLLMLGSDSLVTQTIERIQQGEWVQSALHHTIEEHARVFDKMDDIYLRERASDIRDLGRRILICLQSDTPREVQYPARTILVGEDVSGVELMEVPHDRLAGVVSARGSSASHVAIIARAMGVPAVMGVTDLPVARLDGREVVVDGYRGRVYISPTAAVLEEYTRLLEEERQLSRELEVLKGLKAETTDGIEIPIYLNTGLVSEMHTLGTSEAGGVGLYRTELPFMVSDRFPGENAQIANYRQVLETFSPRPVTLRTLDIGGDKQLPYFPFQESNPFLGWRGVRISLDHPEIFLTQIRAMLRAAIGLDNLRIMLPMITSVSELDGLLLLIQRAHDELLEEGFPVTMPKVGVMVEVPAAVFQVTALARRVDFISIGTNDLTQYLLAVDRNNPHVGELYDELHPAVLKALVLVVEGAAKLNCPVSVCGEMAGNPLASVLLLGMGVDGLSMSAGSLLKVKWVIRSFSKARARQLLQAALRMEDVAQVRLLLEGALSDMGLVGLVHPGK
ncbi:MAG: phosphoenolpyruvate--protein phosphotransferase [Gammaproteobacteria bacterium]|nr:phosphoenolpyruvate--protein phosphotransferase [Gammaproteobacteria bacterium]